MKKVTPLLIGLLIVFHATVSAEIYQNLYVVGNACEAGWNPSGALAMTRVSDNVFTWEGQLNDNSIDQARFKFLISDQWDPCFTCRVNVQGHLMVSSGVEYDLYKRPNGNDGFDNAFQVGKTAKYKIDIDLNTLKMTCTKIEDISKQRWEYVMPELGAEGYGNVFPGVCVPFGMVKLGADCGDKNENSGWNGGGNIHGFSHVHVSGTGGGPKYGNILFQPVTGDLNLSDYSSKRSNEKFALGQYAVKLDKYNVNVRLTASAKVGFHEYTYPQSTTAKIIIDAGSCLKVNFSESQELVASGVKVISNTEVEGYSTIKGGWNFGAPYTVYFYAKTDTPAEEISVWKGTSILSGTEIYETGTTKTGACLKFNTSSDQKIKVKVGISFISTEQAKQNFAELSSWDFDEVRMAGVNKWEEVLDLVDVEGAESYKTIFYSALHHAYLQPVDRTGENPLWKSNEPYYDDYYAIWDTFRATHPLFALLTPTRQADMVRSLIDIYEHEGYMPDARSGNYNGQVQGGSNCDILVADAMVKNLPGINFEKGLAAMMKNAEVEPENARKEGRGGALEYNTKGYVSTAHERSGTRTFEYANCDYAIATVAKGLEKVDIYEKYLQRSDNWKNLWNENIQSLGFNGFLWPRNIDGEWVSQNGYDVFRGEDWTGVVYESYPWEMSFYVPHDVNGLINRCGGKETFLNRLDTYFTYPDKFDQSNHIGLFQVSNEPGFLVPTLYNYVNRPDKTAAIARKVVGTKYNASKAGLPGNDDSGSMSAWFIFHAMGFYPNAGQDVYLISSPVFTKATINLENGNKFEILAPETNSTNIYVQSAKLNGESLDRCWLKHEEIVRGGTLEFVMGSTPSNWAHNGELPPSSPVKEEKISPEIESPKIRVHSYSSQVSAGEGVYNLLAPSTEVLKWCDNVTVNPWVIFELTDEYEVDRFLIRDAKTVEDYNGNMPEYWIYVSTTGTANGDWQEAVHQTGVENENTKVVNLDAPVKARYIKFVATKGVNNDNNPENAIRIYGFDVHGNLSQKTDRGALVSVGSRFLSSTSTTPFYNNARHIFDGINTASEYKWELKKDAVESHYVIVDLASLYNVSKLKTYDSGNINGYKVYVSTQMPDLNGNSSWVNVPVDNINKTNHEQTITPVVGRYMKVEISSSNIEGEYASIYEFEVYATELVQYPEIESPKVRIHSYSSKVNMDEGPFYLLADPDKYLKWCENQNEIGWVVFELADIYNVNRFVFRDAKTREGNANVPEYWVYASTTGTSDGDWTEIVYQTNVQSASIKDITIAPVPAKYIKFRAKRGAEEHAALRLYGFDMFGILAEKTDRGDLVSVGGSFFQSSAFSPYFNNPRNIFDGDTKSSTEYKWEVKKDGPDLNYAIVDLEKEFKIKEFKVYDSNQITGYNVYIATEKPGIDGVGNWTKVVNQELNSTNKTFSLAASVSGRYVKVEIPKSNLLAQVCPIYEFEVYKEKGSDTGLSMNQLDVRGIFYPNPVQQGNDLIISKNGLLRIYSLQGSLLYQQEVLAGAKISTTNMSAGIYLVELINDNKKENGKLIIR